MTRKKILSALWPPATLAALLILVSAICAAGQPPYAFLPQPDDSKAFRTMQAVCQLRVGNASGSGTLVAVTDELALILSCRHVCQQVGREVVVTWPLADGQQTTGIVSDVLPGNGFDTDLAIVVCKRPRGVEPVRYARFCPECGPYFAFGWRSGYMRLAIASQATERPDGLIVTNCAFIGGMSGGPLLDSFGRVVAVVVGSDMRTTGISVDGEALENLLAKYRR